MPIDRDLKLWPEQREQGRTAGLHAAGLSTSEASSTGGILNDIVSRVIEIIVGEAGEEYAPHHTS